MSDLSKATRRRIGRALPTLDDVARSAGVSTATVSRCLNAPGRVREATRRRVEAAVEALGYVPNFAGQALASNRTNTVGAVIPTMENAIFARGLQALEETLAAAGTTLLVASSGYDPEREAAQVRTLLRRGVDGLLLIGRARPATTYELLERHATPTVLAWTIGEAATADAEAAPRRVSVGFDNMAAARQVAEAVLDAGHREIAMIGGRTDWNDRAAERIAGVRAALAARGRELTPERLIEAPYAIDAGAEALELLMRRDPTSTAVICGNDVLAAGAVLAARRRGLRVPDDLSITGFDDIDLAEVVEPGLTTAHVPHRRMGRQAAEALLALRDGGAVPPSAPIEVELMRRGSLGPPRR